MTAKETTVEVQRLLGVPVIDGRIDPGGATERAFEQLAKSAPGAPWPPIGGAGFNKLFSVALRDQYAALYQTLEIADAEWQRERKLPVVGWLETAQDLARAITAQSDRYGRVIDGLTRRGNHNKPMPWQLLGIMHSLEAGMRFDRHLHNGDPLTKRTVQVPAGRPTEGDPPFTWEFSAADALVIKKLHLETDWSVPKMLYHLERFNGFGYRNHHPEVLSPYLWSGTKHYTRGKYVADGRFDSSARSAQVGAALLLHVFGFQLATPNPTT